MPISDEIYLQIAKTISNCSKAKRKKVGCVIVKNYNIIALGYNGMPSGSSNICEENGVTKREVLHAESNAIAKCAKSVNSCDNATLYSTLMPCYECSKLIIQSGISKVVFSDNYRDDSGINLLKQNGVLVKKIKKPVTV